MTNTETPRKITGNPEVDSKLAKIEANAIASGKTGWERTKWTAGKWVAPWTDNARHSARNTDGESVE